MTWCEHTYINVGKKKILNDDYIHFRYLILYVRDSLNLFWTLTQCFCAVCTIFI